mgnify:CR=1 FL=1
MKLVYVVVILVSCFASSSFPADSRLVGDKIEFAIARVKGVTCWTNAEKTKAQDDFSAFAATSPVITTVLTPSAFVTSIASSGIQFENYSDFIQSVNDKNHLEDKIDNMKPSESRKNKTTVDFIKMENAKR